MFRRDGIVDFVISQEIVRCLDEEKLQNTFDNNLAEYPSTILKGNLNPRLSDLTIGWGEWCRYDSFSVGF